MSALRLVFTLVCAVLVLQAARAEVDSSSLTPLEQGKLLRAKADSGDSTAMLDLAMLLLEHAPMPKRPGKICDGKPVNPLIKPPPGAKCIVVQDEANAALLEEWKPVGTKYTARSWITRAAEQGNTKAMSVLCKLGSDAAAPAAVREEGDEWCRRMNEQ